MKRLALLVLLLVLLLPTPAPAVAPPAARVNGGCTGWVVAQGIVATASHCVGLEGSDAYVEFRAGERIRAVVVWDSFGRDHTLDLAFLRPAYRTLVGWPLAPAAGCTPYEGSRLTVVHASGAMWPPLTTDVTSLGVRNHPRWGRVLVVSGALTYGASGSAVRAPCGVVGMITHLVPGLQPPILFGPAADRIRTALQEVVGRGRP